MSTDTITTNLPAVRPVYSREDHRRARAWALSYGEPTIGSKGRVPTWLLDDWSRNLRPDVTPARVVGKRGGRASTITTDTGTRAVTREDSRNARAWALENGVDVPARGRLAPDVLQGWADAGTPVRPATREHRADVHYRVTDKRGRLNGRMRSVSVYSDQLPSTKPRMSDYVDAVSDALPVGARVERITTANTIIDVSIDPENGHGYVYRWVSKIDSLAVRARLLDHITTGL